MPHYTMQSGKPTNTITSRCPICLQVKYYKHYVPLDDESVCCSGEHQYQYIASLRELSHRARRWYQQTYGGEAYLHHDMMEIVEAYWNATL